MSGNLFILTIKYTNSCDAGQNETFKHINVVTDGRHSTASCSFTKTKRKHGRHHSSDKNDREFQLHVILRASRPLLQRADRSEI